MPRSRRMQSERAHIIGCATGSQFRVENQRHTLFCRQRMPTPARASIVVFRGVQRRHEPVSTPRANRHTLCAEFLQLPARLSCSVATSCPTSRTRPAKVQPDATVVASCRQSTFESLCLCRWRRQKNAEQSLRSSERTTENCPLRGC